tara:strand:- start:141 stop:917 length:777 start_codon:yes stop_codon:yes gene_type:complete
MRKKFINKRKSSIIYNNISLLIVLIITLFVFLYIYLNINRITSYTLKYIQYYSDTYYYNLENVKISELKHINKNEILKYFTDYLGKSIFLIPINEIALDIKKNKWIHALKIKSNYRNTLNVLLEEETPLGIYDNNDNKILFSTNLVILEILQNNEEYLNLINFYGNNSINNSKKLLLNFEKDFIRNINSAIFIENRRWNLILDNLIVIKLPEENIKKAIINYNKIYTNLSNQELKDIEIIDLRINDKAIIKYKNKNND